MQNKQFRNTYATAIPLRVLFSVGTKDFRSGREAWDMRYANNLRIGRQMRARYEEVVPFGMAGSLWLFGKVFEGRGCHEN